MLEKGYRHLVSTEARRMCSVAKRCLYCLFQGKEGRQSMKLIDSHNG